MDFRQAHSLTTTATLILSRLYNHVISECFENCCQTGWRGFSSKSLEASEKACLDKCAQKYFLLFQRVGFRFAEMNAQKTQEQMMQQGQK